MSPQSDAYRHSSFPLPPREFVTDHDRFKNVTGILHGDLPREHLKDSSCLISSMIRNRDQFGGVRDHSKSERDHNETHLTSMKKLLFCGLLVVTTSLNAQIAQWTFESLSLSPAVTNSTSLFNVTSEVGIGIASSVHASNTTFSLPSGNGSAKSISAIRWTVGDYWQFQTSTIGFSNIMVSWDQVSSGTGPGRGRLEYSTDGSSFTPFGGVYNILENGSPHTTWGGASLPVPHWLESDFCFGACADAIETVISAS
jgi:hypothetical protein